MAIQYLLFLSGAPKQNETQVFQLFDLTVNNTETACETFVFLFVSYGGCADLVGSSGRFFSWGKVR